LRRSIGLKRLDGTQQRRGIVSMGRVRFLTGLVIGSLQFAGIARAEGAPVSAPVSVPVSAPVTVELRAERSAIARDKKFTMGVHFQLAPGWHVYWRNPGEAGKPTSVMFEPADGFSADVVRWPAPETFTQGAAKSGVEDSLGSGIYDSPVGYGYKDEVVLFSEMTPLPNVVNGARLTFKAKVSWLACSDSRCVPGSAEPQVVLPVRVLSDSELEKTNPLFDRFRDLLPVPIEASSFVESFEQKTTSGDKTEVVSVVWSEQVDPASLVAYQDDFFFLKSSRIRTLDRKSDVAALFESRLENAPSQRVVYTNLLFKLGSGELRAVEVPFSLGTR
jgi:DsbC/DsbD-like thiol-disulfide interchange protein